MLPFKKYVAVFILVLSIANAQDYDYDEPRPAPQRVRPGYSGPAQNNNNNNGAPRPTPVPILKQINRHNEDGSYTYGYESADGSFKIETKLATGEVKGKYGYVDDTGKVRTIEYGATKHGFAPVGEGITVPPPTLVDETTDRNGNTIVDYENDNGQNYYQPQPQPQNNYRAAPRPRPQPQQPQIYEQFQAPQFTPQIARAPQSSPAPSARAQIPGAIQTTTLDFGPPQRVNSPAPAPVPVRSFAPAQSPSSSFGDFGSFGSNAAPSPRITYAQPAPLPSQYVPESRPAPQPQPARNVAPLQFPRASGASSANGGRVGGILDQLSRDYALPEGGAAPLHDISFGYY